MFRQYNSEVAEQEEKRGVGIKQGLETDNPVFKAICQAAREHNTDEVQRLLNEHDTLDIYSDGSQYKYTSDVGHGSAYRDDYAIDLQHFHLSKVTPIALLAYEDNHVAVNLLLQLGANYLFAIYGYAYAGNTDKVNQLVDTLEQSFKNLSDNLSVAATILVSASKFTGADSALATPVRLRHLMRGVFSPGNKQPTFHLATFQAMGFAISGYNDAGYLASQDNILKLFTLTPPNRRCYLAKKLTHEEFVVFNSKANHINKLKGQYQLEFEHALVWMTGFELYMWFLVGMQLVREERLQFQVMILIATSMVPSLTYAEAENLCNKMVLDAYRIPLVSDLKCFSTGFFSFNNEAKDKIDTLISDCKKAQSLGELDETLSEKKIALSTNQLIFFNMNKSKCRATIDKHLPRIQALTGGRI